MGVNNGTPFFAALIQNKLLELSPAYRKEEASAKRREERAKVDCVSFDLSVCVYQTPPKSMRGKDIEDWFVDMVMEVLDSGASVMMTVDASSKVPVAKAACHEKRARALAPTDQECVDELDLIGPATIVPPLVHVMTSREKRRLLLEFIVRGVYLATKRFKFAAGQFCYAYLPGAWESVYGTELTSGEGMFFGRGIDVPDIGQCGHGEGDMRMRHFAEWYEKTHPTKRLLIETNDSDLIPILTGAMLQSTILHVGAYQLNKTMRQTRVFNVGDMVRKVCGNNLGTAVSFVMLCAMMGTDFTEHTTNLSPAKLIGIFVKDPAACGLVKFAAGDDTPAVHRRAFCKLVGGILGRTEEQLKTVFREETMARLWWNVAYWINIDADIGGPYPIRRGWHADDTGKVVPDSHNDPEDVKKERLYKF
jgi:hypothetical protein